MAKAHLHRPAGRNYFIFPVISGQYNLNGGDLSVGWEQIGYKSNGTFSQSSGTNTVTNSLTLGHFNGGTGQYNLNGGDLSVGWEQIGSYSTGTFTQTGGNHTVTNTLTIASTGGAGTYDLQGGTLTANSIVNNDTFFFSDGNLNANFTNNGTLDVSGGGNRIINGHVLNNGTILVRIGTNFSNTGSYAGTPPIPVP
jgi:hypothetical protein